MRFQEWTQELSRSMIERTDESPRFLSWIYDAIDEDLQEEDDS